MASSAQLQSQQQQQQQQQRRRCLPSSSSSSSPAWNSGSNKDWNATTRSRVTTVDFLMDETDARIAAAEYEHASNFLLKALAINNNNNSSSSNGGHSAEAEYDEADADADAEAEVKAEAAFRSACLAASRGDAEAALVLCESALKQCPPQRTSALAKINKLAKHLSLRHRPKAPPPPADVAVPNPCSASVDAVSVSGTVHSEEPNRLRSGI